MSRKEAVYRDRGWLFDQYHVQGKTIKQIAKSAGCAPNTVLDWMVRHKLPRRDRSERTSG